MFNLDPVTQYRLSRPPIKQALAQARFPLSAALHTYEGIAQIQQSLLSQFPYMQRTVQTSVNIPAVGVELQSEQEVLWQFTDDEDRLVVVEPNAVTLSLGSQYDGISDF